MPTSATPLAETSERDAPPDSAGERLASLRRHESRNILVLACYQVMLRIAWIFKTESVIIPAVVDAISGAGWVRGFLPVLNHASQCVTPMLFSERLSDIRFKWHSVFVSTILMATIFALLAALWFVVDQRRQPAMVVAFLVMYALFFSFTGVNNVAFATVQGKLIRPHRRGQIMALSGIVGSLGAVIAAAVLLTRWLRMPGHTGFVYIFAFIAAGFAVAAIIVRGVVEPADSAPCTSSRMPQHDFHSAWRVYTQDRSFRRAANVAMLFILGNMLFPHYNWLATEQLGSVDVDMVTWVIAQNIGVGVFSPLAGMIADRCGNRLALRLEILFAAMVPLLAMLLASGLIESAGRFYWIVFAFLGLMPVTVKNVFNYTLELAHEADHPRYLSTMRICFAVPFVISPLAGLLLDVFPGESRFVGVGLLFGSVSLLMGVGALLTFRMEEPRHRIVDTSELPTVRG